MTMTIEQYTEKKLALLNTIAPKVLELKGMSTSQRIAVIKFSTGSEYLAHKYDGDFAHTFLNSDDSNKELWLKAMGVEHIDYAIIEIVRQSFLFFYNNSLTECFNEKWLKQQKLKAYGNGENWCKAWVTLTEETKNRVTDLF